MNIDYPNPNLRKKTSHIEEKWTLENLRAGLDYSFKIGLSKLKPDVLRQVLV